MAGSNSQPQADPVLAALGDFVRRVCVQTYQELSRASDAGAVKVKTAAAMLDMNESSLRQLIRDGKLKTVRPTPNSIRIPLSEIRRYSEGEK